MMKVWKELQIFCNRTSGDLIRVCKAEEERKFFKAGAVGCAECVSHTWNWEFNGSSCPTGGEQT